MLQSLMRNAHMAYTLVIDMPSSDKRLFVSCACLQLAVAPLDVLLVLNLSKLVHLYSQNAGVVATEVFTANPLEIVVVISAVSLTALVVKQLYLTLSARLSAHIGAHVASKIFNNRIHQPYSSLKIGNTNNEIARIASVDDLVQSLYGQLFNILPSISGLLGVAILLATQRSTTLFLAIFIIGGLLVISARFSKPLIQHNAATSLSLLLKRTQVIQESFDGIRDIIIFDYYDEVKIRFASVDRATRDSRSRITVLSSFPRNFIEFALYILIAILFIFQTQQSAIALELFALVKILPYINTIYASVLIVSSTAAILTMLGPIANDSLRTLQSGNDGPKRQFFFEGSTTNPLKLSNCTYTLNNKTIIQKVSLAIEPNESIALVGSSGSGKSTLMDLMMGILEPTSGTLYYGENLVKAGPQACSYYQQIAHVSQSLIMPDLRIGDLLSRFEFGAGIKGENKLLILLKKFALLSAHSTRTEMMELLSRNTGTNGKLLSGGERQRIAFLIAVLRQPKILFVDEGTSALDPHIENLILNNIRTMLPYAIVVHITHRTSVMSACDRCIHLSSGRILEQGHFTELVSTSTRFRTLVHS